MSDIQPRIIGTEMEYGYHDNAYPIPSSKILNALPLGLTGLSDFLSNGGRLYNDMYHKLEYATPECLGPRQATIAEFAGEVIVNEVLTTLVDREVIPPFPRRKRVIDDFGNTWGYHENYLVSQEVYLNSRQYIASLAGHLATRSLYAGAGMVVTQANKKRIVPAQKMSDISTMEGNSSTGNKALINTRREPLANEKVWARQHVVCGDANISPAMTFLKLGSTSLVLRLVENGFVNIADIALRDPLKAAKITAFDSSLSATVQLDEDNRSIRPIELQAELLAQSLAMSEKIQLPDDELLALELWQQTLDDIEHQPANAKRYVEWMAKADLIRTFVKDKTNRKNIGGTVDKLDRAWDNIDPTKHIGNKWLEASDLFSISDQDVHYYMFAPPPTRAAIRSSLIKDLLCGRRIDSPIVRWDKIGTDQKTILLDDPYSVTV